MFVPITAFDNMPYQIPNLDRIANSFQAYIDLKEEEILRDVLGTDLYEEFILELEANYEGTKWDELVNGAIYSDGRWVGMEKMLTPYIYSENLRDQVVSLSGVGLVVANSENSTVVSPATKMCDAYNAFVRLCGDSCKRKNTMYGFLHDNDFEDIPVKRMSFMNEFGL